MSARAVTYLDSTLRDGDHALRHSIDERFVEQVAGGLARAGVPYVEVGHGAGLGGSSRLWGTAGTPDPQLLSAARRSCGASRLAAVLIPGLGTLADVERVTEAHPDLVRVATHCTEADVGVQHIRALRELGVTTGGFLQMSHAIDARALAEQAAIMEDAGAQVVWVADTAGHMLEGDVRVRVAALRERLACEIGLHMHNNLGLAVGNTLAGIDEGATWVDGSLAGLGAGPGNAPTEVLAVVLARLEIETGLDAEALLELAASAVRPRMEHAQEIDRDGIVAGDVGVHASALHSARDVADRYGLDAATLLREVGRRRVVAGQDDLIEDVALELVR